MRKDKKEIATFLFITILLALYFYYKLAKAGALEKNYIYVFGLMWMPAFAAITTKIIYGEKLKTLGFYKGKTKYLVMAYVIPFVCSLIVYSIVWLTGLGGFNTKFRVSLGLFLSIFGVFGSCVSAAGEEIGWRGLLVPKLLKKYSFEKTCLISGVIWYLYHLPLIIFTNYNDGKSKLLSMVLFGIMLLSLNIIINFLRVRSGSIFTAILTHASHNLFIQGIFTPLTINKTYTEFITTEFGIGMAIIYFIFALFIVKKYKNIKIRS